MQTGRTWGIARVCGVETCVHYGDIYPNTRCMRALRTCGVSSSVVPQGEGCGNQCALADEAPANTQQCRSEPTPQCHRSRDTQLRALKLLSTSRACRPANSCASLRNETANRSAQKCAGGHFGLLQLQLDEGEVPEGHLQ